MNPIQRFFVAALVALTGLWVLAEPPLPQPLTYFAFRSVFMQYSGILAIGAMSLSMVLATRPRWLEPQLNGLDKMYRLHKWLGITALSTSVLHWWLGKGTKWMVGWGWLTRPARKPRTAAPDQGLLEAWFGSQRHLAETVGEWAFYAAALLMILALVKRFPYHLFAKTHQWLAALYLGLVFHSAVLTKFTYWTQPVGWIQAVLMLAGSVSAVLILLGQLGARRKVQGTVTAVQHYHDLETSEFEVALPNGWSGHAPGQFAFVTTNPKVGAHPFTIASAWNPAQPRITFITKALGDHTRQLRVQLREGLQVTVEGPYGRFNFEDGKQHQIWVGAGIGITPFVARLKHLAEQRGGNTHHNNTTTTPTEIHLFHPTLVLDPVAIGKLEADAKAAGVTLHVLVDARDGLLSGERIRQAVAQWRQASVWFCGPAPFGKALHKDFTAQGLPGSAFHQELFQMR